MDTQLAVRNEDGAPVGDAPHSFAHLFMISGAPGGGKSVTLTGLIVDRTWATLKAIQSPAGKIYKVTPYYDEDDSVLHDLAILKDSNGRNRTIEVPDNYMLIPSTKIFANYHLHGIKYVYCTVVDMIKWLNDQTISNGILGVDESYIEGEARRGSSQIVVLMTQFAQQMRKRMLEMYLLTQHPRFIDWRFRFLLAKKYICRYNENTHYVYLIVKDVMKNKEKTTKYWGPQYWKYYDTNELPEMPQGQIDKAIQSMQGGKKPR